MSKRRVVRIIPEDIYEGPEKKKRDTGNKQKKDNKTGNIEECPDKVGKIAQTYLRDALESGKVSKAEIAKLFDPVYSKQTFGINFPLLSKDRYYDILKDSKRQYRYYSSPISISGKKYYLCSQWFEKSKAKLLTWLSYIGISVNS